MTFKCQISSQLYLGFSFPHFFYQVYPLHPLLCSCHLALSLELSNCVAKFWQVAQLLLLLQLLQLLSAACNEWKSFRNAEFNDDSAKDIRVEFPKQEREGGRGKVPQVDASEIFGNNIIRQVVPSIRCLCCGSQSDFRCLNYDGVSYRKSQYFRCAFAASLSPSLILSSSSTPLTLSAKSLLCVANL